MSTPSGMFGTPGAGPTTQKEPICPGERTADGPRNATRRADSQPTSAGYPKDRPVPFGPGNPAFLLSVLMPVYNERATLPVILSRVLAVDLTKEVIIVDDGSTDGTRQYLLTHVASVHPNVRLVLHPGNRGKGAALRAAIPLAAGAVCLIQDADLEYDPQDYRRLLRPIREGWADAVFGSRFLAAGERRPRLSWHTVGNRLLTGLSNLTTHLKLTDMETGCKVVRTELLQRLGLVSDGFEIEPEITARLAQVRARICEVPIRYHGRGYAEGKKINWKDGVHAVRTILRQRSRHS